MKLIKKIFKIKYFFRFPLKSDLIILTDKEKEVYFKKC